MKLSKESQSEYDALGLPYGGTTSVYIEPSAHALRITFMRNAANRHHELVETVERLRKVLKKAVNAPVTGNWVAEAIDLIAETEENQ